MPKQIKDSNGKVISELFQDADIKGDLHGKTLAVIGYASQGRGQSLCYRDSGVNTILGLRRSGDSWKKAIEDGWVPGKTLFEIAESVMKADIIELLIADVAQPDVYKNEIEPNLKKGQMLVFSHGFNIHFKGVVPPDFVDIAMIAPKGPGFVVREEYEKGFGVPALLAVEQDFTRTAWDKIFAMAKAIGATRPGVIKTTFKDEVESDLFGEQVDLCGGVVWMVKNAFDTLVEAGYNPILAYWEVHHELHGLIAPLAYKYGNYGMLSRVSLTARKGAVARGKYIMDESVKKRMKTSLDKIQSGEFAKEWMQEYKEHGFTKVNSELEELKESKIEKTGLEVRKIMWPNNDKHE